LYFLVQTRDVPFVLWCSGNSVQHFEATTQVSYRRLDKSFNRNRISAI